MAIIRNNKKPIEGLDRAPVRSRNIQLKPGDEKRLSFPAKENQFYQLGISATYRNKYTKKVIKFGKDIGRGARGDYCYSDGNKYFNFDEMIEQAIGIGYNRCEAPGYVLARGETDDVLHAGNPWELISVDKVFVLVNRNVKVKKDGTPRKVKPVVLMEKKSWAKTQLKKLAEKKAKKPVKAPVRKTKTTLNKLVAAHKKAKTSAEREKYRKAIWNKQHPRR